MGSMNVFASGAWRKAKGAYVFAGGAWRKAKAVWVFSGGAWRKMGFGTTFTFGIGKSDRGLLGYSSDARLGITGGGIFPNPVPEIGTITDLWWDTAQGIEYAFNVAGVPAGTQMTLTVEPRAGVSYSSSIRVGGDSAQDASELGQAWEYLVNTYTGPASPRITLSR